MVDDVRQELRHALRSLRRTPAFTVAAILTLALGVGATTAVMSAVYGVFLRPLPYPGADRIVRLSEGYQGATPLRPGAFLGNVTYHAWTDSGPRAIESIEGYNTTNEAVVSLDERTDYMGAAQVTTGALQLVGARAALGRLFVRSDAVAGQPPVVVISDALWRERFRGAADVVGKTFGVFGEPYTIVGVTEPGFMFPARDIRFWFPMSIEEPTGPRQNPRFTAFYALARLKAGFTPSQAAAEGTAVARTIDPKPLAARLRFGDGGAAFVRARTILDEDTASIRAGVYVVTAGVGCILLIVCVSVAGLLLSRGAARRRELAVRAAIGAGRRRLAIHAVAEAVVLAVAGGALGIILAWWQVRALPALAPADFPRIDAVRLDLPVLASALLMTMATAVACALAPMLSTMRVDLGEAFREQSATQTRSAGHLRRALLVAQSVFTVVLLVAAALLGRSFLRLVEVDAGYVASQALSITVARPSTDEASAQRYGPLMAEALEQIRALPDIVAAGIGSMTPLDTNTSLQAFPVPGGVTMQGQPARTALTRSYSITPGFERALGLRLIAGRFFTEADQVSQDALWLVNEEFARLYLPPNPVGRRFPWSRRNVPIQLEIVGVVGNVLKEGNDATVQPEIYLLRRNASPWFNDQFVARVSGDVGSAAQRIRAAVMGVAPDAAVLIAPLTERVAESVARPRFAALVFMALAAFALLLTAIGLFASLSYSMWQRRREFGVRVAFGATRPDLVVMVVRQGVLPVIAGLAIGLAAAAGLTRFMRATLFGVTPLDATAFAAAAVLLLAVAVVACVIPARFAAKSDPIAVLRAE
jgi:predicted permease